MLQVEGAAVELVERAVRDFNRQLVGVLTNEVVSCVSVQGASRNLITRREGELHLRGSGWIDALIRQGVLPVVSALAVDAGRQRVVEVPADEVVTVFARLLADLDPTVVFFTRTERPGLVRDGEPVHEVVVTDLPGEQVVPEPDAVRRVVEAGVPVLVTDPRALGEQDRVAGTHVRAEGHV